MTLGNMRCGHPETPSTLNEVVAQPAAGPVNLGSLGPASPCRAALCPTDLRWIPHGFSRCCIFAAAGKKTLRTGTPPTAHDCSNARRACSSGDVEVSPASCGCDRAVTRVLFLIEGLPMPIEHLKRLQKHFDLCILRAPEHEESEWFRRWRNCRGASDRFPGDEPFSRLGCLRSGALQSPHRTALRFPSAGRWSTTLYGMKIPPSVGAPDVNGRRRSANARTIARRRRLIRVRAPATD